jgi:hypothetical protein
MSRYRLGRVARWTTFALRAMADNLRVACQPRAKRALGEAWRRGWDSFPDSPKARELLLSFRLADSARLLQTFRRILSIGLPLASSSISLSR